MPAYTLLCRLSMYLLIMPMIVVAYLVKPAESLMCDKETQILRLNSRKEPICCYHTICTGNQNFVPCTEHEGHDTCEGCPKDTCNRGVVNSKDFDEPDKSICTPISGICAEEGGAVPVVTNQSKSCYPTCVCDKSKGFYSFNEFSRDCSRTDRKCGKGFELSDDEDKCIPCPRNKFKEDEDGICHDMTECSSNQIEVYPGSTTKNRLCRSRNPSLEQHQATDLFSLETIEPPETTTKTFNGSEIPSNEQSSSLPWYYILLIILGFLAVLPVLFLLIKLIRFARKWCDRCKHPPGKMEQGDTGGDGDSTVSCRTFSNCYDFSSRDENETMLKDVHSTDRNAEVGSTQSINVNKHRPSSGPVSRRSPGRIPEAGSGHSIHDNENRPIDGPISNQSPGRVPEAGSRHSIHDNENRPIDGPISNQSPDRIPKADSRHSSNGDGNGDIPERDTESLHRSQSLNFAIVNPQKPRQEVDHRDQPTNNDQGMLAITGAPRIRDNGLEGYSLGTHNEPAADTTRSTHGSCDYSVYQPESAEGIQSDSRQPLTLPEDFQYVLGSGPDISQDEEEEGEETCLMKTSD